MPFEIARLTIDPAEAEAFEAAVARCAPLFHAAEGCRAMSLERECENPARYLLRVDWRTVDDHMVTFRGSPAFAEWRAIAGPFFREPPVVIHSEVVAAHFGPDQSL